MSELDAERLAPAIQNLSEADKQEVAQHLQRSQAQMQLGESIHNLSMTCFQKCITGKISAETLSSSEQSCAQNCVQRWMDVQHSIVKNLTGQQVAEAAPATSKGFFG